MAFGFTETGFAPKSLQDIKTELQEDFRTQFGPDTDVSDESVFGQIIGVTAKKQVNIWDGLAALYSSLNRYSAEGINLDRAAAAVNVFRLPASATAVVMALYGDIGTVVSQGHLVKQLTTGKLFESRHNVTLSLLETLIFEFGVTALPSTTYTFSINSIAITFTSGPSHTASQIRQGLIDDLASKIPLIAFGTNGGSSAIIQATDGKAPFALVFSDPNMTMVTSGTYSMYDCQDTGVIPAPAGTVNTIQNLVSGLDSVTNLAAGVTGSDVESDTQLSIRLNTAQAQGYATDEAIRSAMLNADIGVVTAEVFSNRTDGVVSGRPAHSFELVVQGGVDQDIADLLWTVMPSGIESYGSTSETIVDSMGHSQDVNFSRPTAKYLWVKATVTRYSEEQFPANGAQQIIDNLVAWAIGYLVVGKDVIRERMFGPIYQTSGIASVALTMAVTATLTPPAPGDYGTANITIGDTQLALLDETRITVAVL